ncbi:hypothetical protein FRX31_009623 [Thalictrum thalictroides]|uniref:Uncharacterized protein n=1 Tax=Thalictrum thalictroides TaxID=46969 RepID=A0A7J6WW49_THATH|nr:hypothetical protein FRX31_009623 [Thalictrum thalictroides]
MIKVRQEVRPGQCHDTSADQRGQGPTKHQISAAWELPPKGWYKLNTDGLASPNLGPRGGGVVIRDQRMKFCVSFSTIYHVLFITYGRLGLQAAVCLNFELKSCSCRN